eukprot:9160338-Pyramimonas_sp.AAC.1
MRTFFGGPRGKPERFATAWKVAPAAGPRPGGSCPPARPHLGGWLQRQGPVGPEVAACDPGCTVAKLWAARRWCCAAQGTTT